MKKLVFSLIFINFLAINYNSFLFSDVINQNSINFNKRIIKVAAFFSKKSLISALKEFETYDIYLEYKDNFVRFFIVNVSQNNLEEILKKIRKNFPDAFIYKKKLSRNSVCFPKKRVVNKNGFKIENKQKKQTNFLNSDTILQTRKKFY